MHGVYQASVDADVDQAIARRYRDSENDIWCFHGAKNPCLAVTLKGELACLHYFPHERHPGFMSNSRVQPVIGDDVEFRIHNQETVWVPRSAIVSTEDAGVAMKEFMRSPSLPSSLTWLNLGGGWVGDQPEQ